MEMSKEMRELIKKTYENNDKICSACSHKCFGYILSTYINKNGYEFFTYQYEHKSLPIEVNAAFENLLNFVAFQTLMPFMLSHFRGANHLSFPTVYSWSYLIAHFS